MLMRSSRRTFLKSSLAATAFALSPKARPASTISVADDIPLLNLHKVISSPVTIEKIEVLRVRGELFVRTTASDGATGVVIANSRLQHLLPVLGELVLPVFQGQDARDLERLVADVYTHERNYKNLGLLFWNCVGHVEWSLFDLLGKVAGRPAGSFFGEIIRSEVPVYASSFALDETPQATIKALLPVVEAMGTEAIKLQIGGPISDNADALPGRTEALIPLARKTFGDGMTIYADANGSYDALYAIEIGRMLESYGVALFEEPCPWEDFVTTKLVADTLTISVAGGEQDTSLPKFQWMVENRGVDLLQPDLMHSGGFVRTMRVAQMAQKEDMLITPHSPTSGPGAALMLQFASVVENLGPYQEHRPDAQTESWYAPDFRVQDGKLAIPTGPGLGVTYEDGLFAGAEVVL